MKFQSTTVQASVLKNDAKAWGLATKTLVKSTVKMLPALGQDFKSNRELWREAREYVKNKRSEPSEDFECEDLEVPEI